MKRILLFTFLLLLACATSYTGTLKPVLVDLDHGMPAQAMSRLREVFPDTTGRDRLLYLMELGNLARYAGQTGLAQTVLLQADRLSDIQRGTDLGQQAQSMITSDLALEFRGADFEKVFINYTLAASYAAADRIEDAVVEARRVNEKLSEINSHYGENANRYTEDAFVRYFMGVLYEMDGDYDDALISYRLAMDAYDSVYIRDYQIQAPDQLRSDAMRLADYTGYTSLLDQYSELWPDLSYRRQSDVPGEGEVVAIIEMGSISPRIEGDFTVYSDDRVYRVALPVIPDFPRRRVSGSVSVGDRQSSIYLVQDMNGIARENLEDEAGRNLVRAAARLAVKAGVSELGENITEQLTEDENVSTGVGLILSIFGAATEQADLRAWLTLPAQIHMTRMSVPQGEWPVTLTINGRTYHHDPVTVIQGEISLIFLREEMRDGYRRVY